MKEFLSVSRKNVYSVTAFITILFMTTLLVACSKDANNSEKVELVEGVTQVYYIDTSETKIVGENYVPIGSTQKELVEEYFEALSTDPKSFSLKKAKPDNLKMEKYNLEDGRLSIYFNSDYNNLIGISEVLCRATIVKTLSQIEGVDTIEFYVSEKPLMGSNEKPIGNMSYNNFIGTTGAEVVFVTVYFSNEKGKALVDSNLKITTYDGNNSIEKLILERLIAGPIDENMIKTIPEGTKLIKVTTKDGICYVDFNEKFLDKIEGVDDKVVIYSVVNSLVELSTINKVEFTINGATKKFYREGIAFDSFFERKLELVEGSK